MSNGQDDESEDAWIVAAQGGDEVAFTKLVKSHQARVRAYVAGYVRDRSVADDLCQDAFVEAFRHLSTFRRDVPLSAWLLAIARNRTIDHLRRELRRREREADPLASMLLAWHLDDAQQNLHVVRDRELRALQQCVETLPPASAALVHDHYLRGRRAVEIAAERGVSPGTVRMTLLRVRAALRSCIQTRLAEATRVR